MPRKKSSTLFEDSLQGLEDIVEQLEQGDISLEDSLKSFELFAKSSNLKIIYNDQRVILLSRFSSTLKP